MRWYKRQTTFNKLLMGFGLMDSLVGFVGYLGIQVLYVVNGLDDQLYMKHALPLAHLRAANTALLQRARMVRNVVLDTVFSDPKAVDNWVAKREQFGVLFQQEYAAYLEADGVSKGEGETAAMDKLVRQLDQKEREVIVLALAGKPKEANNTLRQVRVISSEIDRQIDVISAHQFKEMRWANGEANRVFRSTSYLIAGATVLVAILAITTGFWIARLISRPLVTLSEELARVGIGGETVGAEFQFGDEVERVIESTRHMVSRLQRMIGRASESPTGSITSVDFLGTLAQEIAERKRSEAELAQRDEQLRQSQKLQAVGSLAGGIAHEFNNLLQAIRGYTRYGMEGLSHDDPRYQDLEQVIKAADRAAALTRQLLGFSRSHVLERVTFDPSELIGDLVKMLRPLIGEHLDLEVSFAPDVCSLYADRGLLQQMLLNLCINARDAMPEGGGWS
jgi:signal transduction histidine kinase